MTQQKTIAVVGLGLLGRGIATCLLGHGHRVIGCDLSPNAHDVAHAYIASGLRELVINTDANAALLDNWKDRYYPTERFENWGDCEFVIETVVEELEVKREVFEKIECVVQPDVPIASNTSSIPISIMQQSLRHPERFLGMHWFEPAHATRFLELIPGEKTTDATMDAAIRLGKQCGKEPCVLTKDIPGFIVNRLAYAMYREALHLLELGVANAETIDRSFRNACGVWSTICGPFQWIDLTGGPTLYAKCIERLLPTLSNVTELPEPISKLVDEGAQGVTNGRGFYKYTSEQAENANELFHQHAWRARALMNEYFPLQEDLKET